MPRNTDRLDRYRQKRQPGKTPEPFGEARVPATGRLFVLHKHHARNLHWDLRLEWEGALESWAVPKGPSPNPADKRLAMHVEPHPLDYAEFEGVIPEGEYGAGPSIVWDKGIWIPKEDFAEGLEKGKLLFELRGYKVRGVWTLIHTPKAGENNWLLIKEKDAFVDERGTELYPDESIYSGLDVDDLPKAEAIAAGFEERAEEAGAKRAKVNPRTIEVMKATPREDAFTDAAWVFELKYDGYRLIAARTGEEDSVLISRNGNDLTETFPEIARAVKGLPYEGIVLDGEVVVLGEQGVPSFDRLQRRGKLQRRSDIARAALELPAVYYAFDLLAFNGLDLRKLPLTERKALLQEMVPPAGPIRFSEHIPERGEAMYDQVVSLGLEGIVAKRANSAYVGTRSKDWFKIPAKKNDDFVVVGWSDPKGARVGLGSLHLAQYVDGELTYAGGVGTGFSDSMLNELYKTLEPLELDGPPPELTGEIPHGRTNHWVEPKVVVQVQFKELTDYGFVRHAVFQRVRKDKKPKECVRQEKVGGGDREELPEPPKVMGDERTIPFSNLDKVFWPEDGYTKGDLIDYYRKVWPWLGAYLKDRPLVLTRYPDGIEGKSFYQKDAPEWTPDWLQTVTIHHEGGEKAVNYFVANDVESLLYVVNLGTIPLHLWHSRINDLEHPDWCLMDLDPKDAPFAHVVEVALFLHELCGEIQLPHYVKTTGSSGIHILIPLARQMNYEQSRTLGELLARVTVKALPKISTITRAVKSRGGKVYVDFMQNAHGQLMASPFSARPKPGATVSAPLTWDEVGPKLDLRDYTIKTVPPRMEKLQKKGIGDPCGPVLEEKPNLLAALQRLTEKMK